MLLFHLLFAAPLQSECFCSFDPAQHLPQYNNVYLSRQGTINALMVFQARVCSHYAAPLVFTLQPTTAAAFIKTKIALVLQLFSCPSLHCLHKSMTSRFTPGAAPAVAWCSRIACTGAEANQANPPRGQPGRCQASTTRPPSYIPSLIPSRGDLF